MTLLSLATKPVADVVITARVVGTQATQSQFQLLFTGNATYLGSLAALQLFEPLYLFIEVVEEEGEGCRGCFHLKRKKDAPLLPVELFCARFPDVPLARGGADSDWMIFKLFVWNPIWCDWVPILGKWGCR